MRFQMGQIFLRDTQIEDMDDYIRWYTTATEWMNWDAPWENEEGLKSDEMKAKLVERIHQGTAQSRSRLEICLGSGKHIGWVTSYFIDGDPQKVAIGIDIPEECDRGRGNGRSAFACWIDYLFAERGLSRLYTQTWSGNIPMIKLAQRLGFHEVERRMGIREVRGDTYDAITYEISKERFYEWEEAKHFTQ